MAQRESTADDSTDEAGGDRAVELPDLVYERVLGYQADDETVEETLARLFDVFVPHETYLQDTVRDPETVDGHIFVGNWPDADGCAVTGVYDRPSSVGEQFLHTTTTVSRVRSMLQDVLDESDDIWAEEVEATIREVLVELHPRPGVADVESSDVQLAGVDSVKWTDDDGTQYVREFQNGELVDKEVGDE